MSTSSVQTYIPLEDCKTGRLYRLRSRNLACGVFDGDTGFLGIRTKFGRRFVFTEYHWDHPPFATAKPVEDMGFDVPEDMLLTEHETGFWDQNTDREVIEGDQGWVFKDSGEDEGQKIRARMKINQALFDWLEPHDGPARVKTNEEQEAFYAARVAACKTARTKD